MKNKFQILTLLAAVAISNICNAQWQSTFFPTNGIISALANNGTNVYAGVDATFGGSGVYVYGSSWSSAGLNTSNKTNALAVKGNNVFAAAWIDAGVYYSNNSGTTWTQTYNGLPTTFVGQLCNTYALAMNSTFVFVGTDSGVFKTNNNGTNWTVAGLPNKDVRALAINGNTMIAGTYGTGAYLSTDNGSTWTAINNGSPDTIISLAISGSTIYAGSNSGVYISNNNGSNWSAINNGLPPLNVNAIAIKGSAVFIATSGGVYVTSNNGNSWTPENAGLFTSSILSLTIKGGIIYAGTNGAGVFSRPVSEMTSCFANYTASYDAVQNMFNLLVDSASAAIATSYIWSFGDGVTSTLATPTHIYAVIGLYDVCMTLITAVGDSCTYCHTIGKDANGNIILKTSNAGFTLNVQNSNTAGTFENNMDETNIEVFPNPFSSQTILSFNKVQQHTSVKLIDVLGKTVASWFIDNKNTLEINKGALLPGIYFMHCMNGNQMVADKKIIIQ